MRPLTPKQKKIVEFITSYGNKRGYSPSLEEIAQKFGKAISTIHKHIKLIQNKGYLQKESNQSRSVSPLERTSSMVQIPLLGIIAAGTPIEPIESPEPIDVPISMVKNSKDYYALKVKGDSMINDDVWDGDIILIKHQQTANVGDMVVAVTNGEVTLKRFGGRKDDKVILIPKNQNMAPFEVNADDFEVRGKFAGLIRRG
jgi:repressor LexA